VKEKMFITRIDKCDKTKAILNERIISVESERVGITIGKTQIVITPDFDGCFRIHKRNLNSTFDSTIVISPSCANEILIK